MFIFTNLLKFKFSENFEREPNSYTVQRPYLHQLYGNQNILKISDNQNDELNPSISELSNANPIKRTYKNINLKSDVNLPSQKSSEATNFSGLTNLFNNEAESVIPIKKENLIYDSSSTYMNPNPSENNFNFKNNSGIIRTTISYKFNQINKKINPFDEALKQYEEKLQPLMDQINEIKENIKKINILKK